MEDPKQLFPGDPLIVAARAYANARGKLIGAKAKRELDRIALGASARVVEEARREHRNAFQSLMHLMDTVSSKVYSQGNDTGEREPLG